MKTTVPTKNTVKRDWQLIDAKGEILGRIASQIAILLMGKNKSYFVRNTDCGDFVVVINAKEVKTTGNKEKQKLYRSHSGFPKGFKELNLAKMRVEKPEMIITHAVSGMLPQNKLRDRMLTRLYVFADENHDYKDKFSK